MSSKILNAIGKALGEIPVMPKDCSGYGYKYTSLDTIQNTIKPILRKYEIDYIQPLTEINGEMALLTKFFTFDGADTFEYVTPLPKGEMAKMNNVQAMGATITYFRRYAICSFLGILADEDIDARSFEQNQKKANTPPVNEAEYKSLCAELDGYVKAGVLKGAGLDKAKAYINNKDIDGIKKVIAWCDTEMHK